MVCQLLDTLSLGLVSSVSIVVTRVMCIIQEVSYYDTSSSGLIVKLRLGSGTQAQSGSVRLSQAQTQAQ